MRIAFVGRARSGKTACAAAFSRYLAARDLPVLAIDAAADRRLGTLLAATPADVRLVTTDVTALELSDGPGRYVVVDLPADAPPTRRYDLTVMVAEPTRRDVAGYRGYTAVAARGAVLRVLGNKISDWGDAAWLTEQVGDPLLGCIGYSAWVRAAERGRAASIADLEPGNTAALAAVLTAVDALPPATPQPPKPQQGDPAATGSRQDHPAQVRTAYSASSR